MFTFVFAITLTGLYSFVFCNVFTFRHVHAEEDKYEGGSYAVTTKSVPRSNSVEKQARDCSTTSLAKTIEHAVKYTLKNNSERRIGVSVQATYMLTYKKVGVYCQYG